jgi:hypothetical protein
MDPHYPPRPHLSIVKPTPPPASETESTTSAMSTASEGLADRLADLLRSSESTMLERVGQDSRSWLQSSTPRLLKLVPAGIPKEILCSDTEAYWLGVEERIGQCEKCPTHGGACAGSRSAIPDGKTVARAEVPSGINLERCARWTEYKRRVKLSKAGVPDQLLGVSLATMLAAAPSATRQTITRYVADLKTTDQPWMVICGGSVSQRTRLLAAVLKSVIEQHRERCLYDYCPQLFKKMLAHMNAGKSGYESDVQNPLDPIREAWFFALDFVDRTKGWSPWFLGEMDNLFFGRWGKPMAFGTPRTPDQIVKDFEQSSQCFESAVFVDATGFGR